MRKLMLEVKCLPFEVNKEIRLRCWRPRTWERISEIYSFPIHYITHIISFFRLSPNKSKWNFFFKSSSFQNQNCTKKCSASSLYLPRNFAPHFRLSSWSLHRQIWSISWFSIKCNDWGEKSLDKKRIFRSCFYVSWH